MNNQTNEIISLDSVYITDRISEHIYRISELGLVNCYLVVGDKKAMLIDCCDGLSYILPEIRKITNLPVFLAATHAHADHIGGSRQFGKLLVHKSDVPIVFYSTTLYQRSLFLKRRKILDEFKSSGGRLPLYRPFRLIKSFKNGDIFDLGGVCAEVIHTPGHTLGSCVFKIPQDNVAIVGDNFIPMLYLHYPYAASLTQWVKSYEKLMSSVENYIIYGGHGRNAVSPEGLRWQYETAEKIIRETAKNDKHSKRKVHIVTNKEHQHLIIKYRTDKIL